MKQLLFSFTLVLLTSFAVGQSFPNGYAFYLPPDDSTSQTFLPEFPADPIGAGDELSVNNQGEFVIGSEPIRFWGVNITAAAAFPPKNKAGEIAARMRKMGINLVRFHHLDNPWAGNDGSIFINSQGTRNLNPVTLDRMMFFIAALKRNGIYVNMNLNVSRTFRTTDGVAGADSLADFGKAVTVYDPWLIFLQKEYADQVLSHVNPYTGLALKDDPVLGMVEIINENTVYGYWKGDRLQPIVQGGALIQRHSDMLDDLWHDFLIAKYQDDAGLTAAWNQGTSPVGQGNQIQNGDFESGNINTDWILELHSTANATMSTSTVDPYAGSQSAQVDVIQTTGTDWHLQFMQTGMSMEQDSVYALTFAAKSDANHTLSLGIMQHVSPYDWYGGTSFSLTSNWQTFTYTFTAPTTLQNDLRITFSFNNQVGSFWFDDISLGQPSKEGLAADESLAQGTVRRIPYSSRLTFTDQRVKDQAEFYIQIQRTFLQGMNSYLQDTIGISVPITGTNALVGPADAMHQQDLDYIDDHNYWGHPWFPNAAWDPWDWQIPNQPALKDPEVSAMSNIFSGLAIANKPYTVSEYNHPFPNRYQVEMMPMLTAYASFHGADGLMLFEYEGGTDWDTDIVDGFFSVQRNTALMSLMPSCAYAYRHGYIAEASSSHLIEYSPEFVWQSPFQDNSGRWGKWLPYPKTLALTHHIETVGYQGTAPPDLNALPSPSTTDFLTTSGEIRLQTDIGIHSTAAEGYASIAGFLADAPNTQVGDLRLVSADEFGAVNWISLSGDSLLTAERSLLSISSRLQNTNMIWDGTQTVHDDWGSPPTLMQPLELTLQLNVQADSILVYPLDEMGQESTYTAYAPIADNLFQISIDQQVDQTPWYGIEARGEGIALSTQDLFEQVAVELYPNPAQDQLTMRYEVLAAGRGEASLVLYDMLGKRVGTWKQDAHRSGMQTWTISVESLASGLYTYRFELDGKQAQGKLVIE